MIILKNFSRYDDTDTLKRAKDSDILAAQKKSTYDVPDMVGNTVSGAAIGAGSLAGLGALAGLTQKGARMRSAGKWIKRGGIWGAGLGAGLGLAGSYLGQHKQAQNNRFYNRRLKYAQTQAKRRELKDWKTNMTQRDGYSY